MLRRQPVGWAQNFRTCYGSQNGTKPLGILQPSTCIASPMEIQNPARRSLITGRNATGWKARKVRLFHTNLFVITPAKEKPQSLLPLPGHLNGAAGKRGLMRSNCFRIRFCDSSTTLPLSAPDRNIHSITQIEAFAYPTQKKILIVLTSSPADGPALSFSMRETCTWETCSTRATRSWVKPWKYRRLITSASPLRQLSDGLSQCNPLHQPLFRVRICEHIFPE